MTNRWRITHEDDVARIAPGRGPARMDLAVHAAWDAPRTPVSATRYRIAIARQIRQDLWRALRTARGFAPMVEVTSDHGGTGPVRVMATAGGRMDTSHAPRAAMAAAAQAVLDDAGNRQRWHRHAARVGRPRMGDDL
jgi:hypothetical protein